MMNTKKNKEVVEALCHAFEMEAEKIEGYLAISANLKGADTSLQETLEREVDEELQHAGNLAAQIKKLGGTVPGRLKLRASQRFPQLAVDSSDVLVIIKGAIAVEEAAILQYKHIASLTKKSDSSTYELAMKHQADEERHRREFEGFLWGMSTDSSSDELELRAGAFGGARVA